MNHVMFQSFVTRAFEKGIDLVGVKFSINVERNQHILITKIRRDSSQKVIAHYSYLPHQGREPIIDYAELKDLCFGMPVLSVSFRKSTGLTEVFIKPD